MNDFKTMDGNHQENSPAPPPASPAIDSALDEIDRLLHQILSLAEESASDGTVDRHDLQRQLERLKTKIDNIADTL